ncbi:MAG: NUDIX domain-containing protein [Oscillospiraceae bacterium]|nr:NUDIX domain-containing protein [Oscillospiraceae bacterium]
MKCKCYPFNTLGNYIYADVIAFYKGKWLLSKHKERTTWETQGGHIEAGETPLEAAKRELFEESGAIDFDIEPLCDYSLSGSFNGVDVSGNSQVFIAKVHSLGEMPHQSEMEKICLLDSLPDNLTYLELISEILPIVIEKLRETE